MSTLKHLLHPTPLGLNPRCLRSHCFAHVFSSQKGERVLREPQGSNTDRLHSEPPVCRPSVRAAPSPVKETHESSLTTQGTQEEPRFSKAVGTEEGHLEQRCERQVGLGASGGRSCYRLRLLRRVVWWFILRVNVTGPWDTQVTGKHHSGHL